MPKVFASLSATLLLLTACAQQTPMPLMANQQPAQFQAQASGDENGLTVSLVRNLFKENFADDVDNGRPAENVSLPRGGFIFERLNNMDTFRKIIYPLSDRAVVREFSKPGVADNIPPISPAEVQQLLTQLQPGDVLLCGNNNSFVHAALYIGNGTIIHALATQPNPKENYVGVVKETLLNYTQRINRDRFVVLRKPGLTSQDVQNMSQYAHQHIGKGYDSLFLLRTEDRFYCTEFVFQALKRTSNPARIFPHRAKYGWDLVTVEDIMDSPDLQTVWTYNRTRNQPGRIHRY